MMNLIATILVYVAFLALFVGGVSILRPLTFLGIWSRFQGLMLVGAGILVFLVGVGLPAPEKTVATPVTRLDEFMPAYQFGEFHSIRIQAPRQRVYTAMQQVTADEITLFRTLTWIRRLGRPSPESILNASGEKPLLDVAKLTGFLKLAEEPGREIVLGTLVAAPKGARLKEDPTPEDFKALQAPPPPRVDSQQPEAEQEPNTPTESGQARDVGSGQAPTTEEGVQSSQRGGFALAAINFRLEDAANGETLLTTETRVYATDPSARKKFAAYWRIIYPGSALIRIMWLRAIRHRAEPMPG